MPFLGAGGNTIHVHHLVGFIEGLEVSLFTI